MLLVNLKHKLNTEMENEIEGIAPEDEKNNINRTCKTSKKIQRISNLK